MQEEMQGKLIPDADGGARALPVVARGDTRICTAARMRSRRPADYARAVSLLAEGVPVFRIAQLLGASPNTIYAIRRSQGSEVERMKQSAADKCYDLADAAADAAADRLADPDARQKIPYRDLMIGFGVAIDKAQLLSGGATARLDISRDDGSEFERLTAEADAVVIGLAPYARGQKEDDPGLDAGPAGPGSASGPDDGTPDAQSSGEQ